MLKKGFRLRKKEDFDQVFRRGKPLFFGEIGCKVLPNKLSHLRLGFSFSKKHLALATERNTLRRVLSEVFTLSSKQPAGASMDIVFFTVKKPKDIGFSVMKPMAESVIEHLTHPIK